MSYCINSEMPEKYFSNLKTYEFDLFLFICSPTVSLGITYDEINDFIYSQFECRSDYFPVILWNSREICWNSCFSTS